MRRLIFLENNSDVALTCRQEIDSDTELVALTADALQALEETNLPHKPVSAYVDNSKIASVERQVNVETDSLLREIETYISDRYSTAKNDGPGFLTGNGYYIQYSVGLILTRSFLMRETIRTCKPEAVLIYDNCIDPWFSQDGYVRNPWLDVLEDLSKKFSFDLQILPIRETDADDSKRIWSVFALDNILSAFKSKMSGVDFIRNLHLKLENIRCPSIVPHEIRQSLKGIRLLFSGSSSYDWKAVFQSLKNIKDADCYIIKERDYEGNGPLTRHHVPIVKHLWKSEKFDLDVKPFQMNVDDADGKIVAQIFDEWLYTSLNNHKSLNILDFEMLPHLMNHLRRIVSFGPALMHYHDMMAQKALEIVKPHAVCFSSVAWFNQKRMSYECMRRNIPVISYQHGGVYGTHDAVKNEQLDPAYADYFLTYGGGIRPPEQSSFMPRAEYVSVGSTRVERSCLKKNHSKKKGKIDILWISEVSTRNTTGGAYQVEDTKRYLLQKQCIEILARSSKCFIIYRPYKETVNWDGTSRWIKNHNDHAMVVDSTTPLDKLICKSDIIITDNTSGTIWNEVLALNKPLILYCDPNQTRLLPHYVRDLGQACHWCRDVNELYEAIDLLIEKDYLFLDELTNRYDSSVFLKKYVLHRDDGCCVQRVLSFLSSIYSEATP